MPNLFTSTVSIIWFQLVQINLYRIGGPILILLGTISCLLSSAIFKRHNLRRNPCTIYILSFNLSNLLLIYSALLAAMLDIGYNVKPSSYNILCCRIRGYLFVLADCLSSFYLVLASIDRMFVTSPDVNARRRSNSYFAYKCILIGTLFWMVFSIHAFILSDIVEIDVNYFTCYMKSGIYPIFIAHYSWMKMLLTSFSLIIFASLTLRNIRSVRRVCGARIVTNGRTHTYAPLPKDRKFILVVFMNIIAHVICGSPVIVFFVYQLSIQYQKRTIEEQKKDTFFRMLVFFGIYVRVCFCGFINLLISKTMRQQIKNVFLCRRSTAANQINP